jgi:hypothetical protein
VLILRHILVHTAIVMVEASLHSKVSSSPEVASHKARGGFTSSAWLCSTFSCRTLDALRRLITGSLLPEGTGAVEHIKGAVCPANRWQGA